MKAMLTAFKNAGGQVDLEEAGYELPEIVFWNVEARDTHLPVTQNEKGVKIVSGASANIFANVGSDDLKPAPFKFTYIYFPILNRSTFQLAALRGTVNLPSSA
ncbi:MAG: DUF2828 family protein [Treponema sp.]|nr:DUF2828 family protein [Treponema sp.]